MIIPQVNALLQDIMEIKYTEPLKYKFRGSGLPYCHVAHLLTLCHEDDEMVYERPLAADFFLNVGTAVHTVVQRLMVNWLWGDWICEKCQNVIKLSYNPGKCCGKQLVYQELQLKVPGTDFSGHPDGVLRLFDDNQKPHLYMLEAKTCASVPKQIMLKYKYQASAYHHLLKEQYQLDLEDEVLFYFVPRTSLKSAKFLPYIPDKTDEFLQMLVDNVMLPEIIESKDLSRLNLFCKEEKMALELDCMWRPICFSPLRDKLIKDAFDKMF